MEKFSTWPIVFRSPEGQVEPVLPEAVLTLAPPFRDPALPEEVGLLLPNRDSLRLTRQALAETPAAARGTALGLFLADPFLHLESLAGDLVGRGVAWVVNFPSVAQQDPEFVQQLADVGLDGGLELRRLAALRDAGLGIVVAVAGGEDAAGAIELDPAAILVLPRVADFAAGFPSFRQRGAAAAAVRVAGWQGPLLGLGQGEEATRERLWPDALDGLLLRPAER